jgi:hypothetical protein
MSKEIHKRGYTRFKDKHGNPIRIGDILDFYHKDGDNFGIGWVCISAEDMQIKHTFIEKNEGRLTKWYRPLKEFWLNEMIDIVIIGSIFTKKKLFKKLAKIHCISHIDYIINAKDRS